jgi:hypothetical protein
LVVPNGTAPQDVKVEAITKMVAPTDVSELRALLGTYNYYRKFVKNFARKAAQPVSYAVRIHDGPSGQRGGQNNCRRMNTTVRLFNTA